MLSDDAGGGQAILHEAIAVAASSRGIVDHKGSPEMWLRLWDSVCVAWPCVARTQPCAIRSLPHSRRYADISTNICRVAAESCSSRQRELIMRLVSDLFLEPHEFNMLLSTRPTAKETYVLYMYIARGVEGRIFSTARKRSTDETQKSKRRGA